MTTPVTETRSVIVEREIPFPPEKIWRALTQPHLIAEWLMKNDFEPVVGHSFNFRADWGAVDCRVQAVEPNKTLSYTWGAYVSKVSSPGHSLRPAPGPTCAWSKRASGRISSRPIRAPSTGGRGSLGTWSRSWGGSTEAFRTSRHPDYAAIGEQISIRQPLRSRT